ncbi:MAG: hypothetical protein GXP58_03390 [Deltaproteobacteria bacterium]|nr:hypothetical protein [Deltaproteobacteria bacterium]
MIAFCRWAAMHDIDFHVIANGPKDPIFLTAYKEKVLFKRKSEDLDPDVFMSWVNHVVHKYGYDRVLILPTTEYLNRFLLEHREEIEAANCIVPLVEKGIYAEISDKKSFASICRSFNLDVPEEFIDIPSGFPFVAKPMTYFSSTGRALYPYIILNRFGLEKFLSSEDTHEFFFQEYVAGRNIYLLGYIRKTGNDILFAQENLMQQANGKSILLARRSGFHQTPLAERYVEMLHKIGFAGLIMIELRVDKAGRHAVMIEANPRLWGPMQFIVDNGIDLFGKFLQDHGFVVSPDENSSGRSDYYFWSGGISRSGQPITFHNYSADQFLEEFPAIRTCDIFLQQGTFDLFLKETNMGAFSEI